MNITVTCTAATPVTIEPKLDCPLTYGETEDDAGYLVSTIETPSETVTFAELVTKHLAADVTVDGNRIDTDTLNDMLIKGSGHRIKDADAATIAMNVYQACVKGFSAYEGALPNDLFVQQAAAKANLPLPDQNVLYTFDDDVAPAVRAAATGVPDDDTLLCSIGLWRNPRHLCARFANEEAFETFKQWAIWRIEHDIDQFELAFDRDFKSCLESFSDMTLDTCTKTLVLRDMRKNPAHVALSNRNFANLMTSLIHAYKDESDASAYGLLPFDALEFAHPRLLTFLNMEKLARLGHDELFKEFTALEDVTKRPPVILDPTTINSLLATERFSIIEVPKNPEMEYGEDGLSRDTRPFSDTPPTTLDLTNALLGILKKMANENRRTRNVTTRKTVTYFKPNRRYPDDPDKPGATTATNYYPTIHIYFDTSGSIREEQMAQAFEAVANAAIKCSIDFQMTSFSTSVVPTPTKIKARHICKKRVLENMRKADIVNGGTDFECVWRAIQNNAARRAQLSIIVTDFEWEPPTTTIKHPRNLYYAPVANIDWNRLLRFAKHFENSMSLVGCNVRDRMLF